MGYSSWQGQSRSMLASASTTTVCSGVPFRGPIRSAIWFIALAGVLCSILSCAVDETKSQSQSDAAQDAVSAPSVQPTIAALGALGSALVLFANQSLEPHLLSEMVGAAVRGVALLPQ